MTFNMTHSHKIMPKILCTGRGEIGGGGKNKEKKTIHFHFGTPFPNNIESKKECS
jgi:hypothetical protein